MRFVVVDKEAVTFDDEHNVALVKVSKDVAGALSAVQRVRELATEFDNADESQAFYGFFISMLINKALDGEQ